MVAPWCDSDRKDRSGREYRCYVGNLPWSADDRTLMDAFADFGPVSSEIAWTHETGRSRGFGFVYFEDGDSLDDAIEVMAGQVIGGRTIAVLLAGRPGLRPSSGGSARRRLQDYYLVLY
ncbi:glycine-rich RNA-binding protein-like [Oryza brachyantha]|uniref:RRM domain-containing protein n=1 Tax=Oryza brachyantha TaxID=4533 RepID=J3M519_ORYBR|nr:glycine-rich RNA-binding protein-like [Oryza brachyantha]